MAQDDYWYEIHLSNKQLVFYFMAAATGLILSFLAGVMVGRGVDASADPALAASRAQRAEERVVTEEPVRPAPPSPQELTYAQRLEAERAEDTLEKPAAARPSPPPARPSPEAARIVAQAARPAPATPRPSPPALTRAPAGGGAFAIQVGSFKDRASAEAVMNRLKGKGLPAYVQPRDGGLFNVRVGPYGSRADAEQVQGRIKQQESPGAFIVAN